MKVTMKQYKVVREKLEAARKYRTFTENARQPRLNSIS